ncbi:MAG TPA: allantoinase AllB [Vicinamibacterales bacterium]|nr:allantoinase AllB [Vicinamibacterales bacterium]
MFDLIIRHGTVVLASGSTTADVAIGDGRIAEIGPELGGAPHEIDARGLFVLPGLIDVHVHFNEPGRTHWEGAATGSRALAAGGGTLFFDMPLNSTPCCVSAREVDRKREALERASITDFGLWGGLVPGAVGEMAEMAQRGVVGFKAFMCDSGLPEFPRADDETLRDGMVEAARLHLPVAVHAESQDKVGLKADPVLAGPSTDRGIRDFLESRPVAAETEAIGRALELARETGAALHIVHVSTGRGVSLAADARARGVDVSIETCPHYLWFTEADVEHLGTIAKCAPPLRAVEHHDALWNTLITGHVDIVASDHSPTEPAMKAGDFIGAWGGIAGVQSTLPVLLERGHHNRRLPIERIAELIAATPARRFRIARKGTIAPGNDADLVLIDPAASFTLQKNHLQQRHKASPYVGATFRGVVRATLRRGETIFMNGEIIAGGGGQFVRPDAAL